MLPLFAQATTEVMPIAAALANIGFVGWLAWFLVARSMPKMQADFSATLKEQRDDCAKQGERERAATDKIIALVMSGNTELMRENGKKLDRILEALDDLKREGVRS